MNKQNKKTQKSQKLVADPKFESKNYDSLLNASNFTSAQKETLSFMKGSINLASISTKELQAGLAILKKDSTTEGKFKELIALMEAEISKRGKTGKSK